MNYSTKTIRLSISRIVSIRMNISIWRTTTRMWSMNYGKTTFSVMANKARNTRFHYNLVDLDIRNQCLIITRTIMRMKINCYSICLLRSSLPKISFRFYWMIREECLIITMKYSINRAMWNLKTKTKSINSLLEIIFISRMIATLKKNREQWKSSSRLINRDISSRCLSIRTILRK